MASFQQNGDGWAVASSRKGKNVAREGAWAPSGGSNPERQGVGAWKGKQGYNEEGYRQGQWGGSPGGHQDQGFKQAGWKEAGKSAQRNGSFRTYKPSNVASKNAGGSWQSKPRPETWEPHAAGNSWAGRQGSVTGVPPPLANGWQWGRRSGNDSSSNSSFPVGTGEVNRSESGESAENANVDKTLPKLLPFEQSGDPPQETGYQSTDGDDEILNLDSDEDFTSTDGYDSEGSDVSHETLKKDKWFKSFFESLDSLTIEQVNETDRQWHCPACRGGVGAIDWYSGMQPVLTHAKTMRSRRVKLHRKLALVLEEELRRRGAACVISDEMFGKWKGLQENVNNQQIVWPPIVIIQNTVLDQDENEQWIGMGNKELLEYFKGYKAMKARHAYGPRGHRGMSALIFEESAMGYMEAERLHKHFLKEGKGKDDWERRRVLFHPGGKRILYGYLATKEEMDIFNRHSKGKARLKYEMKSYHQMVVEAMKQMDEDNQKLVYFKTKVAKEKEHSKTLAETVSLVSSKLRMKETEIKIIRQRATEQHEECKKEMDYLEQSYRQQIDQLNEDIAKREQELGNMQEEFQISHLDRCHQLEVDSAKLPKDNSVIDDKQHEEQLKIEEEIATHTMIVETSFRDSEEYERERLELIKAHDRKRRDIKLRQLQEEVAFEKEVEQQRIKLLEKYAKKTEEANNISG